MDRALRPARRGDDLARPRDRARRDASRASARGVVDEFALAFERRAAERSAPERCRPRWRRRSADRLADGDASTTTRSRSNPGGMDVRTRARHGHGRPARAQAAVVRVPAPGGPRYRELTRADRGRQPAHRLPGGGLPERRRVLGARHGDLHDPRRHMHAPLRLLQRQDRQADLERPARARPRRALGRAAWGCATR